MRISDGSYACFQWRRSADDGLDHRPRRGRRECGACCEIARVRDVSVAKFNGEKEAVSAARDGFDEARIFGIVREGVAELADGSIQAGFEVNEGVARPKASPQFLTSRDLAGLLGQGRKHLKRLFLQTNSGAEFPQFASPQIHHVGTELERRVAGGRVHSTSISLRGEVLRSNTRHCWAY